MAEIWKRYGRDVSDVKRVACGDDRWTLNFNDTMNDRLIMVLLWRLYGVTLKLELTQYNTIQYNTIELYCPVNGKFVCSVRVKVNKNTIVIKKKNKST